MRFWEGDLANIPGGGLRHEFPQAYPIKSLLFTAPCLRLTTMVSASFPVLKTRLSGIIPRNARLRLLTDPWRQHPRAASSIPALGSLQTFEFRHETPHIGTRFPKSVQLSQVLTSPNSDLMLKDLATFISHRGVVFFENQDIEVDGQKALGTRLGELAGKPATSTLHIYPNDYADSVRNEELPPDVSRITSEGCVLVLFKLAF